MRYPPGVRPLQLRRRELPASTAPARCAAPSAARSPRRCGRSSSRWTSCVFAQPLRRRRAAGQGRHARRRLVSGRPWDAHGQRRRCSAPSTPISRPRCRCPPRCAGRRRHWPSTSPCGRWCALTDRLHPARGELPKLQRQPGRLPAGRRGATCCSGSSSASSSGGSTPSPSPAARARGPLLLKRSRLARARHVRARLALTTAGDRAHAGPDHRRVRLRRQLAVPRSAPRPATRWWRSRAAGRCPMARARAWPWTCATATRCARRCVPRRPSVVYHLASLTSVGRSWEAPAQTLDDNDAIAVGMLEALRHVAARRAGRVGQLVRGLRHAGGAARSTEDAAAAPRQPLRGVQGRGRDAGRGLRRRLRPGHRARAAVQPFRARSAADLPALLAGLARPPRGGVRVRRALRDRHRQPRHPPRLHRRARRRARLPAAGRRCSGTRRRGASSTSAPACRSPPPSRSQLLAELLAPIEVKHVVDPARVRAREVMDLRGDPARLRALTGWEPEIPLRQTMADTIDWWAREQQRAAA